MHTVLKEDRLYVTVDALIMTEQAGELKLLLSRRVREPYQGQWALPGRFVAQGEAAETAVRLLLEEMLPVEQAYCEQLYTFTDPARDLRGRVVSIAYLVIVPWKRLEPVLDQAGVTLACFTVGGAGKDITLTGGDGEVLLPGELAFDHAAIVETGVTRLRGKIEYTDIGFRFLNAPQAFALGEVQRIFEAVLGKPQDASNFRRFVLNRYEETGRIEQTHIAEKRGRGRPAVLYRWIG